MKVNNLRIQSLTVEFPELFFNMTRTATHIFSQGELFQRANFSGARFNGSFHAYAPVSDRLAYQQELFQFKSILALLLLATNLHFPGGLQGLTLVKVNDKVKTSWTNYQADSECVINSTEWLNALKTKNTKNSIWLRVQNPSHSHRASPACAPGKS